MTVWPPHAHDEPEGQYVDRKSLRKVTGSTADFSDWRMTACASRMARVGSS